MINNFRNKIWIHFYLVAVSLESCKGRPSTDKKELLFGKRKMTSLTLCCPSVHKLYVALAHWATFAPWSSCFTFLIRHYNLSITANITVHYISKRWFLWKLYSQGLDKRTSLAKKQQLLQWIYIYVVYLENCLPAFASAQYFCHHCIIQAVGNLVAEPGILSYDKRCFHKICCLRLKMNVLGVYPESLCPSLLTSPYSIW